MKRWIPVLLMVLAVLCEVAGSLALKATLAQPLFLIVTAFGFVTAFTLLAACLRLGMPLGVVYGTWAAGGVALTTVGSYVFFHEPMTWPMIVGIVLVMLGVLCVELGQPNAKRQAARVDLEGDA